jgi:beta-N-acetylhexosaminidase
MTAHVVNTRLDPQGHPASLSAAMTQKLLRNQMEFNGIVITDDMQMKAISDHYGLEDAVVHAVNAGADILLFCNQLGTVPQEAEKLIDVINKAMLNGRIPANCVDESYQRILALKAEWS